MYFSYIAPRYLITAKPLNRQTHEVCLSHSFVSFLFYIAKKVDTISDGVKLAAEIIDSGKAMETLEKLIEESNK